jgi:hypothetical protein
MNKELWDKWIENINWILTIAKKRHWDTEELEIKSTVTANDFISLENHLDITYPDDFKEILTNYSSGILLNWQIEGEETEGEYKEIFCGGGRGYLWDFSTLKDDYENYQGWIKECFSNEDDEYDKVWYNKIPFLDVPNGDVIAFGEKATTGNPVIYLSHDGSDFHGHKLGDNFVDFITKWTKLGCIGTEEWQFEVFYDYERMELKTEGQTFENWIKWLQK